MSQLSSLNLLLQVLDDHHQERKLDAQRALAVGRARNVVGGHIRTHDLQHGGLDVTVG